MVRIAAPPQLLPYTIQDVLTTAIYSNMGHPHNYHHTTQRGTAHNCHPSHTTWDSHPTGNPHTTVTHPTQQGTPTQPPGFLESHHKESCGWGGGSPHSCGFSLPTPTYQQNRVELGGVWRKREPGCSEHDDANSKLLGNFIEKDCFSPARTHVCSGSHDDGPWKTRMHRTIWPACR